MVYTYIMTTKDDDDVYPDDARASRDTGCKRIYMLATLSPVYDTAI